jgi:hypothetical protein
LQLIGTYFYSIWHLFSKGNPLDTISQWLIENRYFKNRNLKLQASETPEISMLPFTGSTKVMFAKKNFFIIKYLP